MCLLALKHLVSVQDRPMSSVQVELDLHTTSDKDCWFDFVKVSVMRVSIPLDLSGRTFIPIPPFILSRRSPPLLTPPLVLFRNSQKDCVFISSRIKKGESRGKEMPRYLSSSTEMVL